MVGLLPFSFQRSIGHLDKSKTDLETAKGTNTICAVKTRQQVSDENIWTPWNGGYSLMVGLLPFSFQRSIGPISVSSLCNFCNSGVE
jgi:hypothetical protein